MENLSSMNDQFLGKINQIIETNLDNEHFSVEDLAQKVSLSRSMLHRKLIKLNGKSASDLITEKRLLRAKEMLENNVATASEVAYKVGFNSPSYFTKVFKKYYHVSPGDVRKGMMARPVHDPVNQEKANTITSHSKGFRSGLFTLIISLIIISAGIGIYFILTVYRPVGKSIAVLPLHNLTGHSENDYFVDGLHDALIGELGQIGSLRVISRTSTLRYRNSDMLLKDIAKELSVNTIVEGSVLGAGDSLRMLIQLIDVFPKERHLLANEYTDGMQNVLTVQSNAVKDIADKINLRLTAGEEQRFAKPHEIDPETYKAYLRGMYYLNQGTAESFEKGINCLQQAIDRDPGDAHAYAGLAVGYALVGHGQLNSEEAFLQATSCAKKAIKLDPTIDEAHTALSILYLYDVWDWPATKEAFENALASNPNNEVAHAHFAWYLVLFNDMEGAIYHTKKAVMIEPFSPAYASWLALLYYTNKNYDEAEFWAKKSLTLYKNEPYGYLTLSLVCLKRNQYPEALGFIEKLPSDDDYYQILRAYVYAKSGQKEKAFAIWNMLEEASKERWVNSCYRGMLAACLGMKDEAFSLLNDACDKKYYPITYISFYPLTEDIRNDSRYDELLYKMNLPSNRELITSNQ
jgi:TolB-like protein/AraC-like DNA-binding protein/Tfp pilus assembly protein PilF